MTRAHEVPSEPLPEWEDKFPERKRRAIAAAHGLSEENLADHDTPLLIRVILDEYAATRIVPRFDLKWNKSHEEITPGSPESPTAVPMQIEFNVPLGGASQVLFRVPDRVIHSGGNSGHPTSTDLHFLPWHVSITLTVSSETEDAWASFEEGLRHIWEQFEELLLADIRSANEMIDNHRTDVEAAITPIIKARRVRVVALRSAAANLSIPLQPTPTPSVTLPVKARLLTLAQVERARSSGVPELTLADEIADSLISMITSFSLALERLPKTADKIVGEDEESIRDLLLFILNANYAGLATGETFVGAGKTDILLRWQDKDAFIAECKFWNGESRFKDAIDQLLSYAVWRDTRIALVLFIRDRVDVTAVIGKAIACIRRHERYLSQQSDANSDASEFTLASTSDKKRAIRLKLLTVAIPRST